MAKTNGTIRSLILKNLKDSGENLSIERMWSGGGYYSIRNGDGTGKIYLKIYTNLIRVSVGSLVLEEKGNDVEINTICSQVIFDKFDKHRWKTKKFFARYYSDFVLRYFKCIPYAVDMVKKYHYLVKKYYPVYLSYADVVLDTSYLGIAGNMRFKNYVTRLMGVEFRAYYAKRQMGNIESAAVPFKILRAIDDDCKSYKDFLIVERFFEGEDILNDIVLVYLENMKKGESG